MRGESQELVGVGFIISTVELAIKAASVVKLDADVWVVEVTVLGLKDVTTLTRIELPLASGATTNPSMEIGTYMQHRFLEQASRRSRLLLGVM